MKTCMHNQMHNYVCDSKCMSDFYNPPMVQPPPSLPAAAPTVKAEQVQCDTCHGQGEICVGQQTFGYMSMQPPEPIMEVCPECGGEEAPSLPAAGSAGEEVSLAVLNAGWAALAEQGIDPETVEMLPIYRAMHAALSAQQSAHVSVSRELLADLVSQDHDTRVQAERRLYYALLNGGEA
jgi:hypothetical protein